MDDVLLQETRDGVRTLTLHRPDRGDSISAEVQSALLLALQSAETDADVKVVVLTGAGEKLFSSGADMGAMNTTDGFLAMHEGRAGLAEVFLSLMRFPKPTLCRVNGHVMAGAMGLMLACDVVVAVSDAHFSTPEITRGIFPYMISALIVRNVGRKRAFELMLLGEKWTAVQAREAGLINWVVERPELDATVQRVARRLAGMSPVVLKMGKQALNASAEMGLDEAMRYLHAQLTLNLMAEDAAEGISAFMEKREPCWKGR